MLRYFVFAILNNDNSWHYVITENVSPEYATQVTEYCNINARNVILIETFDDYIQAREYTGNHLI